MNAEVMKLVPPSPMLELAKQVANNYGSNYSVFSSARTFFNAFKKSIEIPFNPKWSNGTGYFDFAVYGNDIPEVSPGTICHSWTPGGRCLMIIGTRLGNVVVFTRFDDWHKQESPVFVMNIPKTIREIFNVYEGAIEQVDMELLVGGESSRNIGHRIEDLYTLCKRSEKKK